MTKLGFANAQNQNIDSHQKSIRNQRNLKAETADSTSEVEKPGWPPSGTEVTKASEPDRPQVIDFIHVQ